jgi:MFS family permease
MTQRQWPVVLVLGTTQTLAWASSYYIPAILADRIARDSGVSTTAYFAIFSGALLLSAVLGPRVGRWIDAHGGSGLLALSNIVLAAGLMAQGLAHGPLMLALSWLLLGVGMAMGLYDAGFATLGRIYGTQARRAITGITLIAGFASTVGWPLSAWGEATIGWRATCFSWAAAHLVIGLPLNRFLIPRPAAAATPTAPAARDGTAAAAAHVGWDRPMLLLAFAFAGAWMVVAGMAAHLPRMLEAAGASSVQAVAAGALIGPAQVGARLMEAGLLARFHPLVSARLAAVLHPIGATVLLVLGGPAAASAFAVLHGAGSGIMTIARGSVPLAIFGPENYGWRLGLIGAPARMAQAAAPLLFGVLIERLGAATLYVSSALCLAAFAAFFAVRSSAHR